MNDPWTQFKTELKEYWSFYKLPIFSSLKILEGNILKLLTILGFLSLCAFGWFLRSEGIPYSAISWDIHFVSFFSFLFSMMFWCLISAPLMMYLSELLSIRESVLVKEQQWLCSFWCRCFGFSFFLYFFILSFCYYKEPEFYYAGYAFFIAALLIFLTILYFFIAEENKAPIQ